MTTQNAEYLVIKNLEFEIKRSDVDGKVFLALHKGKPVASAFDKAMLKERVQANTKFWLSTEQRRQSRNFFEFFFVDLVRSCQNCVIIVPCRDLAMTGQSSRSKKFQNSFG